VTVLCYKLLDFPEGGNRGDGNSLGGVGTGSGRWPLRDRKEEANPREVRGTEG
jgi:hypothetical protein